MSARAETETATEAEEMKEKRLTLRLPPDLYEELIAFAKEEDRHLNAQAVRFIREALRTASDRPAD